MFVGMCPLQAERWLSLYACPAAAAFCAVLQRDDEPGLVGLDREKGRLFAVDIDDDRRRPLVLDADAVPDGVPGDVEFLGHGDGDSHFPDQIVA